MADNKTISKLQINKTTYDLGGSEEGYSITSLTGQEELSTIPSGVYLYNNRILHIKTYTDYSIIIDGEQIYSYGNKSGSTLFDALYYHPTIIMMVDTTGSPLLTFHNAAISEDQSSYKLTDLSDNNLITLGNLKEVVRGYDSDTSTSTIYDDILNSDPNPLCFFSGSEIKIITDSFKYTGVPYVATMSAHIGGQAGSPTVGFTTELIQGGRSVHKLALNITGNGKISISKDSKSSSIITGFSEPTSDTDAANKKYVDTQIASVKPSVQKIEGLVIEPAEQYGWINRSSDILVDLYIGEDAIGYPEMYGSIKIPIAQGQSDYSDDYMRGSYFNTRYKTNNDFYKLKDLLSDYGYNDRTYTVVFLAAQAVSPNSIGFFTWCDDSYNINESSIFDVGFTPGGVVYTDDVYLTLVPKLIRL